jgi:hypothetical protein
MYLHDYLWALLRNETNFNRLFTLSGLRLVRDIQSHNPARKAAAAAGARSFAPLMK